MHVRRTAEVPDERWSFEPPIIPHAIVPDIAIATRGPVLSVGNQTATSVRRSGASGTETAPAYLNFFLDRYAAAYRAELDHLISCAEQGAAPSPGFADGRAALVLADAANESLKTGRAVRIDA